MEPILYIFAGLPGSGKSTLSKKLAKHLSATYIRIDTVEQGLRDICKMQGIEGEGYRLSYKLVQDNLKVGNSVIADSVNPWKMTRNEWNNVASEVCANFVDIEIVCSDQQEHKNRVENRVVDIENLQKPGWEEVLNSDYHQWDRPYILIDTAGKTVEACFAELLKKIKA